MVESERILGQLAARTSKAAETETATMESALALEGEPVNANSRRVEKPFSVVDVGSGRFRVCVPYGSVFMVPTKPLLYDNAVIEVPVIADGTFSADGDYCCFVRKDEPHRTTEFTAYIEPFSNESKDSSVAWFRAFSLSQGKPTQYAFGAVVLSEGSDHIYSPRAFEVLAVVDGEGDHPSPDGTAAFMMYAPYRSVVFEDEVVPFANRRTGNWIPLTCGFGEYWCWLGVQDEPDEFKAYIGTVPPEFPEVVKFPVCVLENATLAVKQLAVGEQVLAESVYRRTAPFRVFSYTVPDDASDSDSDTSSGDQGDGWKNGLKIYIPNSGSLMLNGQPVPIAEAEGNWYYMDLDDDTSADVWWCCLSEETSPESEESEPHLVAHIVKGAKQKESFGFPIVSLTDRISGLAAVVVGLEDSMTAGHRPGADIDVANMKSLLSLNCDTIVTIQNSEATKARVLEELDKALEEADFVVFYISCHGGNGAGGNFCCLYDGYLHDYEIWDRISRVGNKCWCIFDCCHSETMANIPDGYSGPNSFLSWASCPDDTVGWTTANGSFFTCSIVRNFSHEKLYSAIFEAVHADPSVYTMEDTRKVEAGNGFKDKEVLT